jgi:hypothetical protein
MPDGGPLATEARYLPDGSVTIIAPSAVRPVSAIVSQ